MDELAGDASSKCKEAGGAQDRIIHNEGGSCRGICANGDASLGRKSLESWTTATTKSHMVAAVCIVVVVVPGGGSLEIEIVKEDYVERVITHTR